MTMSLKSDEIAAEGIRAVEEGNTPLALRLFQRISEEEMSPLVRSYFAYCLAEEQRACKLALDLANQALRVERTHPLIYLNIGRIYLVSGHRSRAVDAYRQGLRLQRHPLLLRSMESLCPRRQMLFPFLKRTNLLNIIAGKIMSRIL